MSLLETYRQCMARLNVGASPKVAMKNGLYVPRPHSFAEELAVEFELEPASAHLLVGGIGSGKTTELLAAQARINKIPDCKAIYVDVALHQELERLRPGALVLCAALALIKLLDPTQQRRLERSLESISTLVEGRWVYPHELEDEGSPMEWIAPAMRPAWPVDPRVLELRTALRAILAELRQVVPHFIFLFDSLDRVQDYQQLAAAVSDDVRALQELAIGVVVVAPLGALYGAERSIVRYFNDRYSFLWDIDVSNSPSGREFLAQVLRSRIPEGLLEEEACQRLIELSGGVLRDLIALANTAARRGYYKESERITPEHVEFAAAQAGQKLLFGVDEAGKQTLMAMAHGQPFVLATDKDLELLETRRVLQHQQDNGQARYILNPLLLPILRPKATRAE